MIVVSLMYQLKYYLANSYIFLKTQKYFFKTQKYLFDHYLHFLNLHIINNYINSLFIKSKRLPLRPHVVSLSQFNHW